MSGTIWTKFYWSDWDTDQELKLCTLAAQGLWMRLLCIAASHDPIGYIAVAGRPLSVTDTARLTSASETEVETLTAELERNGVFSRDRHGRIYSRRMTKDAKKSATAKKNGKRGGNPSLSKDEEIKPLDNPRDNGGLNTPEPLTNNQKESPKPPEEGRGGRAPVRKADVDAIWAIAPKASRERSSRGDVETTLRASIGRGQTVEAIIAGLTAYFASPQATKDGGEFVKGIHRMIEKDRWQAFVEVSESGAPITFTASDPLAIWRQRVGEFTRNGYWNTTDWDGKPGRANCRVPAALLAEFGLNDVPQPSLQLVGGGAAA